MEKLASPRAPFDAGEGVANPQAR